MDTNVEFFEHMKHIIHKPRWGRVQYPGLSQQNPMLASCLCLKVRQQKHFA